MAKTGFNPKTNETTQTTRQKILLEKNLPIGKGYQKLINAILP